MKYFILLLFFLGTLFGTNTSYHAYKLQEFQQEPMKNKTIMMIGDSITDQGEWDKLTAREDILNRGISGDTAYGLLNRIHIQNQGIKQVFIMIGINDFSRGVKVYDVYLNYIKIVEFYKKNNIVPVLQSTLYLSKGIFIPLENKVTELNQLMKKYAKENQIVFIDLNHVLSKNNYLESANTVDGIHLTPRAYKIWAKEIQEYLLLP